MHSDIPGADYLSAPGHTSPGVVSEHTKRQVFPEMRLYFLTFITAVCFLFLLKAKIAKKTRVSTKVEGRGPSRVRKNL